LLHGAGRARVHRSCAIHSRLLPDPDSSTVTRSSRWPAASPAAWRPNARRFYAWFSSARLHAKTTGPRSEIDLLVVLKSSDRPLAERVADFLRFIPPYPTDVFPFTLAEIEQRTASGDPFLTRALAEGILLHPA